MFRGVKILRFHTTALRFRWSSYLFGTPDCAIITDKCGCRLGTTISGIAPAAIRSLVGAIETPQAFVTITQSGFGTISIIANYLQMRDAGLSWLFWSLCVLMIVGIGLEALRWLRRWLIQTIKHYSRQQTIEFLDRLIDEIERAEQAMELAGRLENDIRVVAILPVEGRTGVILNIGKEENLVVGTRLSVHRVDSVASSGDEIEELLGEVQVTLVQARNNCSQAIVTRFVDREFWDGIEGDLSLGKRIQPPRNCVKPYICAELGGMSAHDLAPFSRGLRIVRDYLVFQMEERL